MDQTLSFAGDTQWAKGGNSNTDSQSGDPTIVTMPAGKYQLTGIEMALGNWLEAGRRWLIRGDRVDPIDFEQKSTRQRYFKSSFWSSRRLMGFIYSQAWIGGSWKRKQGCIGSNGSEKHNNHNWARKSPPKSRPGDCRGKHRIRKSGD